VERFTWYPRLRPAAIARPLVVAPVTALALAVVAAVGMAALPAEIARDGHGFLLTGDDVGDQGWPLERRSLSLETSMPGVLAAGDIRHGSVKRVAAAVGEGSIAVQLVQGLFAEEEQDSPRAT
jgi:thioredoxin reductase (NADPH)